MSLKWRLPKHKPIRTEQEPTITEQETTTNEQ